MKKEGYYSSGEFAKKAHVTLRTIRYYDKCNILKPSLVTESGSRFYTEDDFARLSQILLFKYLGFSLDDIRQMIVDSQDTHFLESSLNIQLKLVRDRIEQLKLVEKAILDTSAAIRTEHSTDWNRMLDVIQFTGMEESLKKQYQDASNISSRINLHRLYSSNPQGWFPWLYSQCGIHSGMHILELGCGDGTMWCNNQKLPKENIDIVLSDISEGMLRDARRSIGENDPRFSYREFDCSSIPYPDCTFDIVIANHVLFYCSDIPSVCAQVQRVLKPGGRFLCSTYGPLHMKEINTLVQNYDQRIVLSAQCLYERFGRTNAGDILSKYFHETCWHQYDDYLNVTDAQPLILYILSCHGNQNQYLLEHFNDFKNYVAKKTAGGFHITKDAGVFICTK